MKCPYCPYCRQSIEPRTGHRPVRAEHPTPLREWGDCLVCGVDLVPVPRQTCPECGDELRSQMACQMPLFFHGGFGAATAARFMSCPTCGWRRSSDERIALNPRKVA